ncbi:MAG: hypothetical protein WCF18_07145 [Chthoniobacteraceae bacterium]
MSARFLFSLLVCILLSDTARAQGVAAGEAEVQRCEDRIAAVQRDTFNKYEDALAELQIALQKSADLEGALAVRSERQRIAKEPVLCEKDFVAEPKALRALQSQTAGKMQDLVSHLVSETVPKLVDLKKQLTIAGKLDEAISIRAAIEKLQDGYLPVARAEPGSIVSADALIAAYSGNRVRADATYKGQKIIVRGVVGAFRSDPADAKSYQIFLAGPAAAGWVQCSFLGGDTRFREEKGGYNVPVLVVTGKDGDIVRVQKGSSFDVRGVCEGWEEVARLTKCEFAR